MKITKRKAKGVLADMIADMDEASLAKTKEKMERIAEDYVSYEEAVEAALKYCLTYQI